MSVDAVHAADLQAERTHGEGSLRTWLANSRVLAWRQLLVYVRNVPTVLQSLIIPAVSLVLIKVVLGDAVGDATGQDSLYGTVPLMILVGAMGGSMVSAIRLNKERSTGLLARLYVLPINRAADLTSRVLAETVRILVVTLILLAVGSAMGFRFSEGVPAAIALIAVPVVFGSAYAVFVLAIAVNSPAGAPLVQYLGLLMNVLMFFNSGFSPIDAYPGWLQPIVANQPMTPGIDLMRSLAAGGPITMNLIKVAIWAAIFVGASIYPALVGYRKAATSR
ncbi:ABC transporter permease [Gordonia sp. HY002]|uniref:ABC transporter permease n=1 Tax=Gordonia zhenghanii TaxID=2911516 RepID=UPI001EF0E7A1|nr:ABC transporter permease [Gordonia zhenghanii]MCF8568749.1 ABC transporter permease [Gordonia zhenghanii]MCF8605037.1 ABC transporter permease [Gordonia zhenghanii]